MLFVPPYFGTFSNASNNASVNVNTGSVRINQRTSPAGSSNVNAGLWVTRLPKGGRTINITPTVTFQTATLSTFGQGYAHAEIEFDVGVVNLANSTGT